MTTGGFEDYYSALKIPFSASQDEVKAAWLAEIRYWHPDNHASEGSKQLQKAHETSVLLNRAFDILGDAERRTKYDTIYREWMLWQLSERGSPPSADNSDSRTKEPPSQPKASPKRPKRHAEQSRPPAPEPELVVFSSSLINSYTDKFDKTARARAVGRDASFLRKLLSPFAKAPAATAYFGLRGCPLIFGSISELTVEATTDDGRPVEIEVINGIAPVTLEPMKSASGRARYRLLFSDSAEVANITIAARLRYEDWTYEASIPIPVWRHEKPPSLSSWATLEFNETKGNSLRLDGWLESSDRAWEWSRALFCVKFGSRSAVFPSWEGQPTAQGHFQATAELVGVNPGSEVTAELWADFGHGLVFCTSAHGTVPIRLVGNRRTGKYHRPECEWAQQIDRRNIVQFASIDQIDRAYSPCRVCRPG